ncbi:MAG: ATP-binding cassette domain-containing protein [Peptoniphilaceae bacterium]|uniref:methionine ABC transporter ATP-binding protein n=1 Tax=Parvimonas sp. TaxID=1944660 RepID=UPI0025FA16CD|nr:ATP-binding cassette domain-containing protein [Parvimonas sp.]MCI5997660.1 ATP-binding cassette domain-containing protein [Parvimonas sp.]MDD7765385.1 ATP-binding cassette domain-containing protein [Peptoniphilaceae bacterium]MDY3050651.1 ATP-binding cassette domain-containing protein [Parvimonas sp.]
MIEIKNVTKKFETKQGLLKAVDDVTLTIEKGDIYGIIGYSGAGKSTLIRCLNLLEVYDEGSVTVDGKELKSLSKKELLKERESIGMIFQNFNLLQSSNVYENIASPLKNSKKYSKSEIKKRVYHLLNLVGLEDKEKAYPSELSGGQKQRVAIARALSRDCKVLLCDEATSALDPNTTKSILKLLKKINKELNVTIVLITHQMEVVKSICNKIAIMEKGKVVESGNILEIFSNPTCETTKEFILESLYSQEIHDVIRTRKNKENIFSISFTGELVDDPVLSDIQKKYDISVNILFGSIEFISGKKVGNLIVEILGENSKNAICEIENRGTKVRKI